MARVLLTILLALVALNLTEGVACPDQFIRLGNFCYHFTDVEEDWVGARGVCEGIGIFQHETVILGVLDYGISTYDNQLLLTNASARGDSYWIGGNLDQDSDIWRWIDHNNREVDLQANYWDYNHPTSESDCLMITKSEYRSYVKAAPCSQHSKVICQIIPKDIGFRTIGRDKFFFSSENDVAPKATWQVARDYCLSLQPPNSFDTVDLAVLGLSRELDQELLKIIALHGYDTWLGGTHIADGDAGIAWVDGRSIEETSYFLDHGHTMSDMHSYTYDDYFTYAAAVMHVNGHARSTLKFCCTQYDCSAYGAADRCPTELNFVCQAYRS